MTILDFFLSLFVNKVSIMDIPTFTNGVTTVASSLTRVS